MKISVTRRELADIIYALDIAYEMDVHGPGEIDDKGAHRTMRLRAKRLHALGGKLFPLTRPNEVPARGHDEGGKR